MPIIECRRIVNYVDGFGMSYEQLASQLDCSITAARAVYDNAKATVNNADARNVVHMLYELADRLGMTTNELIATYA